MNPGAPSQEAGSKEDKSGLLKSAGIVSLAVAISRLTGVLRESVLGAMFGAGATYDAYVLAFRIPNLCRELFAEGALSSAFVPTFTGYLTTKTKEETQELSDITATMLMAITGGVCLLGILFSPQLVTLFAPGFHAIPGKWELSVELMRTMFPFLAFLALSAQAQGILYARHRFGISAVSSALFNLGSVGAGLALAYWVGPQIGLSPVQSMAAGVVVGGIAQLGFLVPGVLREGFTWRPRWNLRHPGVRHILGLMGPALIGNASGQMNVLVTTNFAAGLQDAAGHVMNGPVSWLSYAYRFIAMPLGLFAVAIGAATLPRISRSAAQRNFGEFRDTLSRSIVMVMLVTAPSAVGMAILGESMIAIVFQHGKFLAFDTRQTGLALACYASGLVGHSVLKLVSPAFYALGDSRTPMVVSLASVVVNAATSFALVRYFGFGFAGLALAAAVVWTFSAMTLLLLIRGRIGGIRGWELLSALGKIGAASAVMGVVCFGVVRASHGWLGVTPLARVVDVAGGVIAGAVTFYLAASLLRVPELGDVTELVRRKLGL